MLLWQSADPPDIAGRWNGEGWWNVVLEQKQPGKYDGTYTDTYGIENGTIQLKWSRIERRFKGTWKEDEDRDGKISVRRVGDEIRGAWTTNKKSGINPGVPELADLLWTRAANRQLAKTLATGAKAAKRSPFPKGAHIGRKGASVMVVHDDVDLHYVFYHAGDFNTSSSGSQNTSSLTWMDEGSITLKDGTTFGYNRKSVDPFHLRVNGKEYDLRQGRVLQLINGGSVEQLKQFPSLSTARDPDGLAKLIASTQAMYEEPVTLEKLRQQLAAARAQLRDLQETYASTHPVVMNVSQSIAALQRMFEEQSKAKKAIGTDDSPSADRGKETLELLELVTGKGAPWVATTYYLETSHQRLFTKRSLTAGVTVIDLSDVSGHPDVTFKVRLFLPHVSRRGAHFIARNSVHLWVSTEELRSVADGRRFVRAFYYPKDEPEGSQLLKATTLDPKAAQPKWLAETEELGDLIAVAEITRGTKPATPKRAVSIIERLQGVWLLGAEEQFGYVQAVDDPEQEPLRVVIEGQTLRGCFNAPWKPIVWSIEFDNETRPQAMYLTAEGNGKKKTRSVRFRLNDDELDLCFNRRTPERLPVELKTAEGSDAIIWHLRRGS